MPHEGRADGLRPSAGQGRLLSRRQALALGGAALAGGALALSAGCSGHSEGRAAGTSVVSPSATPLPPTVTSAALTPPSSGTIPVAVMISDRATVIDFTGPWEVFQDVPSYPFELYTVSASREPLRGSGGLRLVPDYTFDDAPTPKVIVVGAQSAFAPAYGAWLREMSEQVDVLMSVCLGSFILGKAGLLDGQAATTHHGSYDAFESSFPNVELRRGVRWVEGERISTAGGLTSGIDLALHIVERYYGRTRAQATADFMEYQSQGWKVG